MPAQRIKYKIDLLSSPGAGMPKYLSIINPADPESLTAEVMPIAENVDDDEGPSEQPRPAKIVWICKDNPSAGGILDFWNPDGHADDQNDKVLKIVDAFTGGPPAHGIFRGKKIFAGQGNGTAINGSKRLMVKVEHNPPGPVAPSLFKYTLMVRWRATAIDAPEYYIFDPMIKNLGRF